MNNDQSPDPGLDAQHSQHSTDNTPPFQHPHPSHLQSQIIKHEAQRPVI